MDNMMRYGNVETEIDSGDKVSKRRVQNSAAAKRHREKRKRELGDLRDENDWLRTQQAQSRVLIEKMKGKLELVGAAIPDFPASEALPLPLSMSAQHKHVGGEAGTNEHVDEHHQEHNMHDQQHHRQPNGSGAASATGASTSGLVSNDQLADSLAELEVRLLDRSNASLDNVVSSFSGELSGLNRAVKAVREAIDGNREAIASGATTSRSGTVSSATALTTGGRVGSEAGRGPGGEGEVAIVALGRSASVAGLVDDADVGGANKTRQSRTKKHRL